MALGWIAPTSALAFSGKKPKEMGDEIRAVAADWVAHLRTEEMWGLDDQIFAAAKVAHSESLRFSAAGKTSEKYKAWAQNLGHEDVLTSFRRYGDVNSYRQLEIMRSFASPAGDIQDATVGGAVANRSISQG
jgi:hypothetical protein